MVTFFSAALNLSFFMSGSLPFRSGIAAEDWLNSILFSSFSPFCV